MRGIWPPTLLLQPSTQKPSAQTQPSSPAGPLLAQRCGELLGEFSTSTAEDEALLTAGQLANDVELAVRFRLGKKLLLGNAQRSLLANLNARPFMHQQLA